MSFDLGDYGAVSKHVSSLETFYSMAHAELRSVRDLYNLNFQLTVPENIESHIPSTAAGLIDHAADHIPLDMVLPRVDAIGDSPRAIKQAALLTQLHQWFLSGIVESSIHNPLRQLMIDIFLGAAVLKVHLRDEWLTKKPSGRDEIDRWDALRHRVFPFEVRPIDPLSILPPTELCFPHPYMIEKQIRKAEAIASDYPSWSNIKNKNALDDVEVIEVWTPDEYVVYADGSAIVGPTENPYGGIVPYIFTYSGFGRKDASGDPHHLASSLIRKVKDELRAEARVRTAIDVLWQYHAYPRMLTPGSPQKLAQQFAPGPGQIVGYEPRTDLADQGKPELMVTPPPPAHLYQFLASILSSIEFSTYPRALAGGKGEGVEFGYLQGMIIGQGRLRLRPAATTARLTLKRLLSMMAEMVEKLIPDGVPVRGRVTESVEEEKIVRPSDIRGHYDVDVSVEAIDPTENDRRILLGLHPLRDGVISRRRYLQDYAKVQDPEAEEEQILTEQLLSMLFQSPEVLRLALEAANINVQEDVIAEATSRAAEMTRSRTGASKRDMKQAGTEQPNIDQQEALVKTLQRLGAPAATNPQQSRPEEGMEP